MDAVFLPDPLSTPALLQALHGPDCIATPSPAQLPDHALCARTDTAALALVPQAGGSVTGALIEAAPPLRDRIGFALAALGAAAAPVEATVTTATGARPALVWRSTACAPSWSLAPELPDPE